MTDIRVEFEGDDDVGGGSDILDDGGPQLVDAVITLVILLLNLFTIC